MKEKTTTRSKSSTEKQERSRDETLEFSFGETKRPAPFAPIVIEPNPPSLGISEEVKKSEPEKKKADETALNGAKQENPVKQTLDPTNSSTENSNQRKSMPTTTQPLMSDFRKNVERQSREQKSVGSILSTVAYSLIAGIFLVAVLAGFGGYVLWKQIQDQSVTVSQLDSKYQLRTTELADELSQASLQIGELQAALKKQQDQLTRVSAISEETSASLRIERQTRAKEMIELQKRIRRLETIK
jgi:hypothetical protein